MNSPLHVWHGQSTGVTYLMVFSRMIVDELINYFLLHKAMEKVSLWLWKSREN